MKIPAIRAQIGTWVYYVSTLTFKQVNDYVKRIDDELHKSTLLREMLQRSITDNYKNIEHYIKSQDERFFNSLILAVYDGEPKWHEVRLENEEGDDEYIGLGVLELTGNEKIFPIDGQHRVEGIKQVVNGADDFNNEKIPVVFVGHKKDNEGMQRARRLFSTLNRYAKPVSMRDIIALDEDDVIAICSRELIDNHILFSDNRILDSKTKAIPETNNSAFTTIITFYECNRTLLSLFLENKKIVNSEGKILKGSTKINEYIRIRPKEEKDIFDFYDLCDGFWNDFVNGFNSVGIYAMNEPANTEELRNRDGGNLLFRPVGLIPFIRAAVRIKQSTSFAFKELFLTFPQKLLSLNCSIWKNILWNQERKTMIMNNQTLVEIILVYFWNRDVLKENEKEKMFKDLRIVNQLINDEDAKEIVEKVKEEIDY